jgi:hypothetical protein
MGKACEGPTVLLNAYTHEDNPDLLKQYLIRARSELQMQKSYRKWLESKVDRLKKENQSLKMELDRVNAA